MHWPFDFRALLDHCIHHVRVIRSLVVQENERSMNTIALNLVV